MAGFEIDESVARRAINRPATRGLLSSALVLPVIIAIFALAYLLPIKVLLLLL